MAAEKLSREQLAEEFDKIRAQCRAQDKPFSAESAYDIIAADRQHPLRKALEWDDRVAAREWRIWQLAQLMRRVEIPVTMGEVQVRTPLFVHSNVGPGERHTANMIDIHEAAGDANVALRLVSDELRRVLGNIERARNVVAGLKKYPDLVQFLHGQTLQIHQRLKQLAEQSDKAA